MGRGGSHVSNKELSEWVKEVEGQLAPADNGPPSLHGPPSIQSVEPEESQAAAPSVAGRSSDSGGSASLA